MYTLHVNTGVVTRDSDNVVVAPTGNPNGQDYQDYLVWVAAGGVQNEVYDPEPTPRIITKYALRLRFTFAEKQGIDTSTDSGVIVFRNDFAAAEEIDLDSQGIIDGLSYLESVNLLAPGRSAEIRV
jgi:hypothetical protein